MGVSKEILSKCILRNKDGAGFAFRVNGELVSQKGFFKIEPLWEEVQKYQEYEGFIHFRYATKGLTNSFYTHPFPIKSGFFFHNGHLNKMGTKEISDSFVLSKVIKTMSSNERQALLNRLSSKSGSRFAVLTPKDVELYGNWTEKNDLTFSNMNWALTPKKIKVQKYLTKCKLCGCINGAHKLMCASCGQMLNWY